DVFQGFRFLTVDSKVPALGMQAVTELQGVKGHRMMPAKWWELAVQKPIIVSHNPLLVREVLRSDEITVFPGIVLVIEGIGIQYPDTGRSTARAVNGEV